VLLERSLCDPIAEMAVEQSSDGGASGTAVMQGGYPGCSENSEAAVKPQSSSISWWLFEQREQVVKGANSIS
jgi:hypothetical protein